MITKRNFPRPCELLTTIYIPSTLTLTSWWQKISNMAKRDQYIIVFIEKEKVAQSIGRCLLPVYILFIRDISWENLGNYEFIQIIGDLAWWKSYQLYSDKIYFWVLANGIAVRRNSTKIDNVTLFKLYLWCERGDGGEIRRQHTMTNAFLSSRSFQNAAQPRYRK